MVRALWSGATGMIAQQNNVDTIANNIANVNTIGYKTEVNEFKSLLYQNLQTRTTSANGEEKPVGAQVGLGVRNAAIKAGAWVKQVAQLLGGNGGGRDDFATAGGKDFSKITEALQLAKDIATSALA